MFLFIKQVFCISFFFCDKICTFGINFKTMSDSLVIIPTYNEKENIENIIRTVFGLSKPFDILVIDDGSPDGTGSLTQ